jgi:hypothetical protein
MQTCGYRLDTVGCEGTWWTWWTQHSLGFAVQLSSHRAAWQVLVDDSAESSRTPTAERHQIWRCGYFNWPNSHHLESQDRCWSCWLGKSDCENLCPLRLELKPDVWTYKMDQRCKNPKHIDAICKEAHAELQNAQWHDGQTCSMNFIIYCCVDVFFVLHDDIF